MRLWKEGEAEHVSKRGGAQLMAKSFDWGNLLKTHPIFASLNETEVAHVLMDTVSHERMYSGNDLIVKIGESGDSLFLIGNGSVQVTVAGSSAAVLGHGDFFGEIAVLDRRSRSASVTARESCTVLEIPGEAFRQLLAAHPDVDAQLRATANMRLSQQGQ